MGKFIYFSRIFHELLVKMEDELEDNAAMMVEDGAEAATRFSKMEIDCRFEENHVIETLTNDSCYVSRKLATNRNVPGNMKS